MVSPLTQNLLDRLFADVPFVVRANYLASTPSTNDVLKRMADDGASEGTLVVADQQTAGRGRLDRKWVAPAGTSLLFSLLFRPAPEAGISPLHYTMICSLAALDAGRERLGLDIAIKWPNDLVFEGRKLGGILTEVGWTADRVEYVIVGAGINTNWDPSTAKLGQPATSLLNLAGHPVPRAELLRAIVVSIAERCAALKSGQSPVSEWEAALDTVGKHVVVECPGEQFEGTAAGVDPNGALRVRTADGLVRCVFAGDVRVRTAAG